MLNNGDNTPKYLLFYNSESIIKKLRLAQVKNLLNLFAVKVYCIVFMNE